MSRLLLFGGPDNIHKTRSLKAAISHANAAGKWLNIIFVHGIRVRGAGEAGPFTQRIASYLGASVPTAIKTPLDIGPWPQDATMAGGSGASGRTQIWRTQAGWDRSQPFLEITEVSSALGKVRVHEVNYWPLLFPLKARFLLVPEHDLSGNDLKDLKLVAPWLEPGELTRLQRTTPASGGGAKANAFLKQQIMNWGLSDAVIALGPMRHYLHETVDQALGRALANSDDGDEYVVASLSLGSFVVMDAYAAGRSQVKALLDRTGDLYFFANQFALLELARIKGLPHNAATPTLEGLVGNPDATSPMEALQQWGSQPRSVVGTQVRPKQIVAFSDPSDLLTFLVPKLADILVVNVYDRNATNFLNLFENPITAHTGHIENSKVWDLLLR